MRKQKGRKLQFQEATKVHASQEQTKRHPINPAPKNRTVGQGQGTSRLRRVQKKRLRKKNSRKKTLLKTLLKKHGKRKILLEETLSRRVGFSVTRINVEKEVCPKRPRPKAGLNKKKNNTSLRGRGFVKP